MMPSLVLERLGFSHVRAHRLRRLLLQTIPERA